jgi:hypothetical protein
MSTEQAYAQFEKWGKSRDLEFVKWANGQYASAYTRMAFDAWLEGLRAGREFQREELAAVIKKLLEKLAKESLSAMRAGASSTGETTDDSAR